MTTTPEGRPTMGSGEVDRIRELAANVVAARGAIERARQVGDGGRAWLHASEAHSEALTKYDSEVSADDVYALVSRLEDLERDYGLLREIANESEARVEALERNAARYRFLRDNGLGKALRARKEGMELAFGYEGDETVFKTYRVGGYTSELIDTAIDRALAAASPEEAR